MTQDIVGQPLHPPGAGVPISSLLDTAPYRVGSVTLVARDLNGLARFYRAAVGLSTVSQEADVIRLGVGATVLLELRHDPAARPWRPQEAGLFHTAFLLPSRGDLGAWLAHATENGIRVTGAADHLVSEAVYLTDPEGNGIEIYVDRPASEWPGASDGSIAMSNDPLDHHGLVRAAPGPWTGMPPAGRVGHVHLQVGALAPAENFYSKLLGFDVTCRYPSAVFLGAGGYHHQLAANTWNSRGAPVRQAGTTGLAEVALLASPEALGAARTRCREVGLPLDEADGSFVLRDPWGTRLRLIPLSDPSQPASPGERRADGTEALARPASKAPVLG
ncbi:VOC family protein [Methylobacterium sp. J-059]|uniref:VOC family protein n=1 Tax=Methylobacterium sp. J-059 TaxID=2836643 RepID=UPI001FBBB7FF|nr:VOC family protein [Methylobacterium sp. J-059]MCJ2038995.1 VOC family protein [Methylobacterium sp. J-059]